MKVSIGVVALNEEKTLPSLFEDFKMQTYPHDEIEIILVDGISTDDTKNIMQDFKENNDFILDEVAVIKEKENQGICTALVNTTINRIKQEYEDSKFYLVAKNHEVFKSMESVNKIV